VDPFLRKVVAQRDAEMELRATWEVLDGKAFCEVCHDVLRPDRILRSKLNGEERRDTATRCVECLDIVDFKPRPLPVKPPEMVLRPSETFCSICSDKMNHTNDYIDTGGVHACSKPECQVAAKVKMRQVRQRREEAARRREERREAVQFLDSNGVRICAGCGSFMKSPVGHLCDKCLPEPKRDPPTPLPALEPRAAVAPAPFIHAVLQGQAVNEEPRRRRTLRPSFILIPAPLSPAEAVAGRREHIQRRAEQLESERHAKVLKAMGWHDRADAVLAEQDRKAEEVQQDASLATPPEPSKLPAETEQAPVAKDTSEECTGGLKDCTCAPTLTGEKPMGEAAEKVEPTVQANGLRNFDGWVPIADIARVEARTNGQGLAQARKLKLEVKQVQGPGRGGAISAVAHGDVPALRKALAEMERRLSRHGTPEQRLAKARNGHGPVIGDGKTRRAAIPVTKRKQRATRAAAPKPESKHKAPRVSQHVPRPRLHKVKVRGSHDPRDRSIIDPTLPDANFSHLAGLSLDGIGKLLLDKAARCEAESKRLVNEALQLRAAVRNLEKASP
jgi:hypothetical protein